MGEDIGQSEFDRSDFEAFRARLRDETKTLKRWFDERRFDASDTFTTGLEIEAWLVDGNCLPTPQAEEFIATANDARIVPELSKFNFELNADPGPLRGDCLDRMSSDVSALWERCVRAGETLSLRPLATGILPTVRDEMLQPAWMSSTNRYKALNKALIGARQSEPLHICIDGEDQLDYRCDHIMLEAACTSLQAHLKVNQDDAARFYNASVIASAPLVAASANSPFLYGHSLWSETRIPAFEQSTKIHGFPDLAGRDVLRVTLGTGYVRHSLLELFLENLSYPILLPTHVEAVETLPHLRLQNGTIWRWNRPIIGFEDSGEPHLRVEQRVMPSGPTVTDMVANLALYYGLALALARSSTPAESQMPFETARANFYACAREGLAARVDWSGKTIDMQALLLEKLLPSAKTALAAEGLNLDSLDHYFDGVLHERIKSGRTGAEWQRRYYREKGRNFQALTERYVELQAQGEPVHKWTI
ncbi:glutamate--cysteine ligase [Parasphingopyxis lamellibrachiae]|uniref:Gamma-glutamyl:cysteine ligase YbdK (ATP-grasp superfamily) n=1 Tax=Parasphingopyxis lamellibrachiae TaxID=680125 RepID=A0A3D9FIA9_9SPHN|nr:glutamate--cysteine ligase [Parasphingopyxis lamellibrachiae]RED17302.1 gamma-glutamyl:cysteine ligase YbdK (ATP-grasp superfamily) [Parasphingopyxis lamellibrachiae]